MGTAVQQNDPKLFSKYTIYYRAPETILKLNYTNTYDYWSLGCSLYEMITGEILFDPHSDENGSTDYHHLEMMINLCGEFNNLFQSGKYYKKFFKNNKLPNMIYNEDFVRGRIYSYLKFQNYMKDVADIVCQELGIEDPIISVDLSPSGDTVFVKFVDSSFGFDAAFLWDRNLKGTIENYIDQ